jgi:hypothetical protein
MVVVLRGERLLVEGKVDGMGDEEIERQRDCSSFP